MTEHCMLSDVWRRKWLFRYLMNALTARQKWFHAHSHSVNTWDQKEVEKGAVTTAENSTYIRGYLVGTTVTEAKS